MSETPYEMVSSNKVTGDPMLRLSLCSTIAVALALLLLSSPALAFNFPLSDEAIREAYFLGQRRDESMAQFLAKYKKTLPVPDSGPQIASVEFLTPFANLILVSSQRTNYSAQQAALDHRTQEDHVSITIQVQLTKSYGAFVAAPTGTRSDSPIGYTPRSPGFWRDIGVEVVMDDKTLEPTDFTGEPNYLCGDDGGCVLTGATLHLELPAKLFTSDSASVQIAPPEGLDVSVGFDLTALR
jgi:hypothetical protein